MSISPQLRKDPIVDRWVWIAPERGARPIECEFAHLVDHGGPCPFCEGQEHETPHEIEAIRKSGTMPDQPGWQVRVIPNKYPAVRLSSEAASLDEPFHRSRPGVGAHEVVLETPRHETSLARLAPEAVEALFQIYRRRLESLSADPRLQYVQIFKNHGAGAGASVAHTHSQILGLSRVPRELIAELAAAQSYFAEHGRCVFCDWLERELKSGERIVWQGKSVVAIAAWAGRFPYETWILPRRHAGAFMEASAEELAEVARFVHRWAGRIAELVTDPPYNYFLHQLPLRSSPSAEYHWHWELLPRLTGIAGFELAGGDFLNPLPPEEAAARLRGNGPLG